MPILITAFGLPSLGRALDLCAYIRVCNVYQFALGMLIIRIIFITCVQINECISSLIVLQVDWRPVCLRLLPDGIRSSLRFAIAAICQKSTQEDEGTSGASR